MKTTRKHTTAILVSAVLLVLSMPVFADMMIMPTRVFFKDGERMKTLAIVNNSAAQAIYRMEFIHKKQLLNGSYIDAQQPVDPNYDMSKWIVFSPRQIDLPPQGKQAIRMSLRRPADLPDGEYRIHARLTRLAKDKTERDSGVGQPKGAKLTFGVNLGVAVPVVMRKGKYDTTAALQNFKYVPGNPAAKEKRSSLTFEVHRKGKYSAMGKAIVYWTPSGGEERQVGELNGLNVFPDLEMRETIIYLNEAVTGGTFRVVYDGADADKGIKFDEKTFPFPG